jgi:hypothetical protein
MTIRFQLFNHAISQWVFFSVMVSISPTFYARLFCTKVLRKAFLSLHFRFELFWCKNIGANALKKCWWNWSMEKRNLSHYGPFKKHVTLCSVWHYAFLSLFFGNICSLSCQMGNKTVAPWSSDELKGLTIWALVLGNEFESRVQL